MKYHLSGGWYFTPEAGGAVRITKRADAHDGAPIREEVVMDAPSWASIVAAMSAAGNTSDQYEVALGLQLGDAGRLVRLLFAWHDQVQAPLEVRSYFQQIADHLTGVRP